MPNPLNQPTQQCKLKNNEYGTGRLFSITDVPWYVIFEMG
jgi:hypothetical protein